MADFRNLLRLLQEETACQSKLLKLLATERAALVTLNRPEIDKVSKEKEQLIQQAQDIASKRTSLIREASGTTDKRKVAKLSEALEKCAVESLKREIQKIAEDLKETAESVRIVSEHNGRLIKDSLGIVGTTLALMRRTPEDELPTYGLKGKLSNEQLSSQSRPGRIISQA